MKAALQLYSIKNETERDMIGSLKRVAEIGYEGVEFAGYQNISAIEMKKALDDYGIISIGSHIGFDRITNAIDEELEYNIEIGSKYLILAYAQMKTMDELLNIADALNKAAEKAKGTGIKIGYHNHSHEFSKIDGEYALDLLINNTSDDVIFELDVFWAAYAKVDPVEYIKTRKKIEIIHLKEMKDYESKENVEVGSGILNIPLIVSEARIRGAKHFIVEQENSKFGIWDSVAMSMNYLKTI